MLFVRVNTAAVEKDCSRVWRTF